MYISIAALKAFLWPDAREHSGFKSQLKMPPEMGDSSRGVCKGREASLRDKFRRGSDTGTGKYCSIVEARSRPQCTCKTAPCPSWILLAPWCAAAALSARQLQLWWQIAAVRLHRFTAIF